MIIGIDVSSIVIGYCCLDENSSNIISFGYHPFYSDNLLEKYKEIFKLFKYLKKIFKNEKVSICIEEAMMRFLPGKSNSQTIKKLIQINTLAQLASYLVFNEESELINVSHARKIVVGKIPKTEKKKLYVANWFMENHSEYLKFLYDEHGKLLKGSYDMTDAYVIAKSHFLEKKVADK